MKDDTPQSDNSDDQASALSVQDSRPGLRKVGRTEASSGPFVDSCFPHDNIHTVEQTNLDRESGPRRKTALKKPPGKKPGPKRYEISMSWVLHMSS